MGLEGTLARSTRALGLAATAGSVIGGMVLHAGIKTYENVDDARRAVKALLEQSEADSLSMLHHALGMGLSTKFGAKEVEESYKELAGRIHSSKVIESIVDVAAQLARAVGADLPTAVKVLENTLFATGTNVENATEGLKTARKQSAMPMKTAKLGSFTSLEDVAGAVKFAAPPGSAAGLSIPTMGAVMALMHRTGYGGAEAGVALRAAVSSLLKPTAGGLTALDAIGVHWNKYVTQGQKASSADLSETFERRLGKRLSAKGLARVQEMLSTPELFVNQAKFTSEATKYLGRNLKPQDARQIATVLGDFWRAAISKIDVDRLIHDMIAARPSEAQLVEIFGSEQAGRFTAAEAGGIEAFEKTKRQIENVPEDYPEQIAKERMAGFAGAMARLNAAMEDLNTSVMEANDKWVVPLIDETTKLINAFSHLGDGTLQLVGAVGGAASGVAALRSCSKPGRGLAFPALRQPRAPSARRCGSAHFRYLAPALAAGLAASAVGAGSKGLNIGEDEIARQRKANLGAFRWLGGEPPAAGKFTPWAGPKAPVVELRGAARVNVDLQINLADRLSSGSLGGRAPVTLGSACLHDLHTAG